MFIKIIVVLICKFNILFANYCEICRNHTLCLYATPGPSKSCISYDVNATLSKHVVDGILNAINERRNFVALGLSNLIPQAANMKKIVWSSELASSAQRWADQCDPSIRPDKEDQCRDLARAKVGQNIATILGPAPGVHIKSFVELWFIPILKYQGSVLYYNKIVASVMLTYIFHDRRSQDFRSEYFTQLIWAETESVGCGKAKFYIEHEKTTVQRVVCNFAPKGNIPGKPIYALGYSSTQCPNGTTRDEIFQGLCRQDKNKTAIEITTSHTPVSSLLRIINLSNNSIKQEIDPLRNYLNQFNYTGNKTIEQRFQKIRHVFYNDSYGEVKRIPPLESREFWNLDTNSSHNHNRLGGKGHSHVYHGYETYYNNPQVHTHPLSTLPSNQKENNEDYRMYDLTTETININSGGDLRKHNINSQCTRKQHITEINPIFKECQTNICTREEKYNICSHRTTTHPTVYTNKKEKLSQYNKCKCVEQTTTCHPVSECCINFQCRNTDCPLPCQYLKSPVLSDDFRYNMHPKIVLRKRDQTTATHSATVPRSLSSKGFDKLRKISNRRKNDDEYYRQVKDNIRYPMLHIQDPYYSDNYFDSSERKKRELEHEITFKPFWQVDKVNYKKPYELKSLRYTTFAMRNNKKSKKTTHEKKTEAITISVKDFASSDNFQQQQNIKQKYLSFEELMHLRQITAKDEVTNARRTGDSATNEPQVKNTKPSESIGVEFTSYTPFIRQKHCTRKLTCTWTTPLITGADGNILNPGNGPLDRGSRTPPGYVDGCTRTSTCTREFLDRNQMVSIMESENTTSEHESISDDDDYCERRSLSKRKRGLDPRNCSH